MTRFGDHLKILSEKTYYHTQFESVVYFIEKLDAPLLTISPENYQKYAILCEVFILTNSSNIKQAQVRFNKNPPAVSRPSVPFAPKEIEVDRLSTKDMEKYIPPEENVDTFKFKVLTHF